MNANNQKWIVATIIVLGIFGLGFILYLNVRPQPTIRDVRQFPRPSAGHDNNVQYLFDAHPLPPAGGVHWEGWQNCGIYDEPVETPYALHSLEHGAVWITYHPDLPESEVEQLRRRVRGETHLLLSPYPNLQSPVVLTAWGLQLEVDSAADGRVNQFISRYQRGSQTPEPGASCDRGVGTPLQ